MQLSGAPSKIVEPFAVNGNKRTVPAASQIPITPGAASFNDGFPPLCDTPVNAGGIPPSILDMNGILNQLSAIENWMSAGGAFVYDSVFSAAAGGYPQGARLLRSAGFGYWYSTVDNNTTNPDSAGAGWIPDRAYSGVYASAQQTLASGNSKVLWDTVEFDSWGLWNSGYQVFSAIWSGKYRFSGSVYLPSAAAQLYSTMIYKNGSLNRMCSIYPQTSDGNMSYTFGAIITCVAGDQLSAVMSLPTASTLVGQSGSNQGYVYGQLEYLGV